MRAIGVTLLFLTCLLLLGTLSHPADARPITALALTADKDGTYPLDAKVAAYFKEQGITIIGRPLNQPLSREMLRQFDCVLLTTFMGLRAPWFSQPNSVSDYFTLKANLAEISAYVAQGGGLFFLPEFGWAGAEAAQTMGALLDPWGLRVEASSPYDKAHAWQGYGWTTNIAKSPVTANVKTLFYPMILGRWDDLYPTNTLVIQDAKRWTPVVRGMPGSVTAKNINGGENAGWYPQPGSQDPPIMAASGQIGQGRVVVLTLSPLYLLTNAYQDPGVTNSGEFTTGPIDGIVMEKGDGKTASQGRELVSNSLRWLAAPSLARGNLRYTPESFTKLPVPPRAPEPAWMQNWSSSNGSKFYKVLIGGRSSYSDGKGSIADYATAAKAAGYSILVMTETFEKFNPARWGQFYRDCVTASTPELIVIPGLEVPDGIGNRFLLFGQPSFPPDFMLTEDKKALKQVQFLMLGMRPSMSAIARPSTTPGDHHLHKFYAGYVVYTYKGGALVDEGYLGYKWAGEGWSDPLPLVVHETYAPEEVAKEAATGHQLFVPADTAENAAWYLRQGEAHYWQNPPRFLVTAGPMITELSAGHITVEDDLPITEVRLLTDGNLLRRWKPNATKFSAELSFPKGSLSVGLITITDQKGRTAITPPLTGGTGYGYNKRCSDRQNFFGVPIHYPGTILNGGFDIWLPAEGTREGKGLWPDSGGPRRGENMAPLLEFPYVSPAVSVTDAYLDQRYWKAQWEDVAYDARAPQSTARSRVYEGRFRYYDFHYQDYGTFIRNPGMARPMMIAQIELRLRTPVIPSGDVFPAFTNVGRTPTVRTLDENGQPVLRKVTQGYLDLPVGACANNLLALTPGMRVNADGAVGFAAPAWDNGALPAFTSWSGRVAQIDTDQLKLDDVQPRMLARTAPYKLQLTRGKLTDIAYLAALTAENYGIAGTVTPDAKMPYALPLSIEGINWNWPAAVWRPGAAPVAFGVFEGHGIARLEVNKGGAFYAGNVVTAGDPRLRITLLEWTADHLTIEVNNPTDALIKSTLTTPTEITELFRMQGQEVSIEPGACVRMRLGK